MRILKNNLYALKLCYQAAPALIILRVLSTVLEYATDTFISLYFMRFIVESIQNGRTFAEAAVLIVVLFLLESVYGLLNSYIASRLEPGGNVKITKFLMEMLYKQALSVDLSCYENPKFYDTYTKANEQVNDYCRRIMYNLTWVIGVLTSLVVTACILITYEPLVFIIIIIPVLCEQLLIKKYTEYKFNRDKDTAYERRQVDYVNRTVYLADFAKDIRLNHIFSPISKSFHKAINSMRETSKMYGKKIAVVRFFRTILSELFVYLGAQGLIVYQYVVNKAYTLGELTTVLNAASELSHLVGQFSYARSSIYENGMFIENFRSFIDYQTKMPENENGKHPLSKKTEIRFRNVSFTYEGMETPVLKNINLEIKPGERIALVGHNGAGKSTFVKLLMRLYDVTDGTIEVGGTDIRDYVLSEYRDMFGTIFQDFKVFATSITENVILHGGAKPEDVERAKEALMSSGIYQKISELPHGMDSQMTKEFCEDGVIMSGGELQKLAIARVFAKESAIAVLDEPSSALDPLSEYEVFENMLKACEGKTVIFVSHRLSSTVLADRIYMMEQGEIIESGSHAELMKKNGRYAEMFHMQAKHYQEEAKFEQQSVTPSDERRRE